jgi:acetyltransferase AlgX (SGNH hydrolase-like protein)
METSGQQECRRAQKGMGLRFLIPSILVASLILDVALRFVPYERVYYHAWEAASLFATADGSFAPNFRFDSNLSYGDLTMIGNRPGFRHYYREVFTTDEFGFRNSPSGGTGEMPAAILIGDSFAVGASNSDEDTLSAQLTSRLSNRWVYNGASARPQWNATKKLIQRLHMRGGLVIWQVSERVPLPGSVRMEETYNHRILPITAPPINPSYRILQRLNIWTDSLLAYSPLRSFLSSAFRKMENGVWLPNPSENLVAVGHLRNGDSMLFLESEVDNFYEPKYDSPIYLSEISALVHRSGNELLVLLVPDKYGVYYPLLRDERRSPPEGGSHLNLLEEDLHHLGIPVLNLTAPLRSQAAEGLQRREYNYRLDDTHWNRLGIQTAATEVLRAWNDQLGSISNTSAGRNACPPME